MCRKVVSFADFEAILTPISEAWNDLPSGRCCGPRHKHLRKAEEANFKANFSANFSSSASLSTTEVQVFRVPKLIGLYGTVGFIAIRDSSFWGESDLWNDVWPVMDALVCLSILLGFK